MNQSHNESEMPSVNRTQDPFSQPRQDSVPKGRWWNFGILHLLGITTLIAVWLPVLRLWGEPDRLKNQNDLMSHQLGEIFVDDPAQIVARQLPKMQYNFRTWKVYIPKEHKYELRLAVDGIHGLGFPAAYQHFSIPPGKHELSLRIDSDKETGFQWEFFMDGNSMLSLDRPASWINSGGSSSTGISGTESMPFAWDQPVVLLKQRLSLLLPTGKNQFIGMQWGQTAPAKGCYVWVDLASRKPEEVSEWISPGNSSRSYSNRYGIRSGIRIATERDRPLKLYHADSMADRPVATIDVTFDLDGNAAKMLQRPGFWRLSGQPDVFVEPRLPTTGGSRQSLYLRYESTPGPLQAVVEVVFDQSRRNEIGFRLLSIPESLPIKRWSLNANAGESQQWRRLKATDEVYKADKLLESKQTVSSKTFPIDRFPAYSEKDQGNDDPWQEIRFWSDAKPGGLAVSAIPYIQQFRGLPNRQAWFVPKSTGASVEIQVRDEYDDQAQTQTKIPGGPVMSQVQLNVDDPDDSIFWYRIDVDTSILGIDAL